MLMPTARASVYVQVVRLDGLSSSIRDNASATRQHIQVAARLPTLCAARSCARACSNC